MIDYVIHAINNEGGSNILILLDVFFCAVLVPSTYIFKTEAFKEALFNDGWLQVARNLFRSVFKFSPIDGISCCKTRVNPVEEIEMPQLPHDNSIRNEAPIPTISNKIENDIHIKDL